MFRASSISLPAVAHVGLVALSLVVGSGMVVATAHAQSTSNTSAVSQPPGMEQKAPPPVATSVGTIHNDAAPTDAAPIRTSGAPPAIARGSPTSRTAAAPVAGANSFTQGQARIRIEAAGYSKVSRLSKPRRGIWIGTAEMYGKRVPVGMDYQGNVVRMPGA